jgi:two-component system response regulator YesN
MLKLLIVDDEELTRNGLAKCINWAKLKLEVIGCVADGQKALDLFAKKPADIVITDIRMPKMDGLELIKALKAIDSTIVVIFLSAYDDFKYAQQAVKFDAFDYILKPIDVELLQSVVKNAINFKVTQQERDAKILPTMNTTDLSFLATENFNSKLKENLLHALETGDSSQARTLLNAIWNELLAKNYALDLIKRFCMELSSIFVNCMVTIHEEPYLAFGAQDPWNKISRMQSNVELSQWLCDTVQNTCKIVQSRRKHKKLVSEAIRLIEKKYFDNSLTLNMISDLLYVTPNYLSAVFKDETNIGFLEYLTNYRIEKSKTLLADLKYKIYEVCFAVGYTDPHYFSKLFKKATGVTPKDFREKSI